MSLFSTLKSSFQIKKPEIMSLDDYFEECKNDSTMYATAAERMLKAIGSPVVIDTAKDERLGRIFSNRKIKIYDSFSDFFGMEDAIEDIVKYFMYAAQGLEEAKQILYLLGPVGAAKSSLAETLKQLMESQPFYTLEAEVPSLFGKVKTWQPSPVYESPLGLVDYQTEAQKFEDAYKIPRRYMKFVMSPWATKRLVEANGDRSKFRVVKMWPSILQQRGITKVEPGDENNQDISSLVGKVSIHKLSKYEQNDPDAYGCSGGLNVTTQGMLEFVEMFKATIKVLNPLLTATQEGHYNGTEAVGAFPYQGIIMAHSNESEWKKFKNDKTNEAFLDRVNLIQVPYCTRVSEEVKIYEKLVSHSELKSAPIAPGTLQMMAQFSVLTRLVKPENSSVFLKMEVYDGKNMKPKHTTVKSMEEYRTHAGVNEGMAGSSTRFAHKILSKTYNYDSDEIAANPIHLMQVLETSIRKEQLNEDEERVRIGFINEFLKPNYLEFLQDELQKAYIDNHDEYCQTLYERYVQYADHWTQEKDFRDHDTGIPFNRDELHKELQKIEHAAGITNYKEFRGEIVNFSLRARASNGGNMPRWNSYERIKEVIEKKVFASVEELLPVISFGKKTSDTQQKQHTQFIERMMSRGYTQKQINLCVEWYIRSVKHN
jgi:serine protein kinase